MSAAVDTAQTARMPRAVGLQTDRLLLLVLYLKSVIWNPHPYRSQGLLESRGALGVQSDVIQ